MLGLERIAEKKRNTGITFARHERGNGIGLLANIHLAAAVAPAPFIEYPFDPPEWTVERRDLILAGPVVAEQG
ncbi:hypothetical protein OCH7691_03283 [Oceanibacterium hippocampi]|uniref:Enolase C-terminal domain-containing protein n=2 Tax=Oceanibacterium hippocampi TaxID=745714 RepID=A0A1Y5TRT3_9PROT|nr:hypothetical protein OCH7691_03283 [Oceanibacterium hippocampi]